MSTYSSTGNVHLIVTCTRRKTVAAGETVFPDERDAANAYELWLEKLAKARCNSLTLTAGNLYSGQHWNRAAAAAECTGAELWIISAGLGFLHSSDRVMPYEATFSSMPFCHQGLWERLTTRPPTERLSPSLKALMKKDPHDRFVIAASPVYLRAVEEDLRAGCETLVSPEQLTIVTSKSWQGSINGQVHITNAGMMNVLNTNMTGLNISYAAQFIQNKSKLYGKNI